MNKHFHSIHAALYELFFTIIGVLISKVWNTPTSKDFHYLLANERLKSQLAKQAMEGTTGDQLKSNRKYWKLREKGK